MVSTSSVRKSDSHDWAALATRYGREGKHEQCEAGTRAVSISHRRAWRNPDKESEGGVVLSETQYLGTHTHNTNGHAPYSSLLLLLYSNIKQYYTRTLLDVT